MLQSLMIKLAMLAMTLGIVFWIGWQPPRVSVKTPVVAAQTETPAASTVPSTGDGKKAVVPSKGDAAPTKTGIPPKAVRPDVGSRRVVVDLNRATVEELESLPGIGPALARRVVAHRQSAGKFQSVEDLRQVKGIGQKTLDRVRPLVTVAPSRGQGTTEKPPS